MINSSELIDVLDFLLLKNDKLAVFYARSQGFSLFQTPLDDLHGFQSAIVKLPDEIDLGLVDEAISYLVDELEYIILSDDIVHTITYDLISLGYNYEQIISFLSLNYTSELKKLVLEIGILLKAESLSSLIFKLDLDLTDYIIRKSIDIKEVDDKFIFSMIYEKETYLKPLINKAMAKGRNKYGDQSFQFYTEEVESFSNYLFDRHGFEFYFSPYILTSVLSYYLIFWTNITSSQTSTIPEGGIDFEYWCAEALKVQGWHTVVSKASGDQGVDILATYEGMSVAVQCKRYSSPVGNKAVQEVFSGMHFSKSDAACVISTKGFTKSAEELASSTGVILIDAENINLFSELLLGRNRLLHKRDKLLHASEVIEVNFKSSIERFLSRTFMKSIVLSEKKSPEDLVNFTSFNISYDDGSGSIKLMRKDFCLFLYFVDKCLCASAPLDAKAREKFLSSDSHHLQSIGKDKFKAVAYHYECSLDASPYEIQQAFLKMSFEVLSEMKLLEIEYEILNLDL